MRKSPIFHNPTIVILCSILLTAGEAALLGFFSLTAVIVGSILLLLVMSHLFLINTQDYQSVFSFTLLSVIFGTIVTIMAQSESYDWLTADPIFYAMVLVGLNFFIPTVYSLIRCLWDSGKELASFGAYFRNCSILFGLYYIPAFVSLQFFYDTGFFFSKSTAATNYIPFYDTAQYIEDYIYHLISLPTLLTHTLVPVLLWMPAGFFLGLLVRHIPHFVRLILLPVLPATVLLIQFFVQNYALQIDQGIYGLFGIILGEIVFFVLNMTFLMIRREEFLESQNDCSYSPHF